MRRWAELLIAYVKANFEAALEYRASFVTQVLGMLINDVMWLVFWLAYFQKFPLVSGWGQREIVTLWAVVAAGFGLATAVCGNLFRLAGMIVRGELDVYLALPKPVLPHMLVSRMSLTAPGDVLFGILVYALILTPDPLSWLLFATFLLTTTSILVGFGVITQSLAFWLGQAEGLSQQLSFALVNFSTYPTHIFQGAVKIALFTVIPAGFIAYVPVRILQEFSAGWFLGLLGFSGGILLLSWVVFRAGLRRYESGNLLLLRD